MTALDFVIFVTIGTLLHWPAVLANVASTSFTSTLSYLINKHWVFGRERDETSNRRMLLRFLAVTLVGLLVLQNLIIFVVTHEAWIIGEWLSRTLAQWQLGYYSSSAITLASAKLLAVLVSSIWNFVGYKFFVFKAAATAGK